MTNLKSIEWKDCQGLRRYVRLGDGSLLELELLYQLRTDASAGTQPISILEISERAKLDTATVLG